MRKWKAIGDWQELRRVPLSCSLDLYLRSSLKARRSIASESVRMDPMMGMREVSFTSS